ncbi:unnamed protein product [Lathyrus oleraceus]
MVFNCDGGLLESEGEEVQCGFLKNEERRHPESEWKSVFVPACCSRYRRIWRVFSLLLRFGMSSFCAYQILIHCRRLVLQLLQLPLPSHNCY